MRRWGAPPAFDFKARPHWEIGEGAGILDFDAAVKIAGARFAVYKGLGARLERALANFFLDMHTREHGYTEILPPFLVNTASLTGVGQLPKFAADMFHLEGTDLWLTPTSEVELTSLHRDETLNGDDLPMKVCAWTACFRSEAGAAGKDTRGLKRQHQFQKVEMFKFTRPEQSYDELESLVANAEAVLQRLGLHYRVMQLCTADMGFASAKTYDIEVWLPSAGEFMEISSCSNTEAFQARRSGIRFKPPGGKKSEFVHTLEWIGACGGTDVDRAGGKLSAGGWVGRDPGGAAAVYGRRADSWRGKAVRRFLRDAEYAKNCTAKQSFTTENTEKNESEDTETWRRDLAPGILLHILCDSVAFFPALRYETGPTRTMGPVGWGMPPAGSNETANSFGSYAGGELHHHVAHLAALGIEDAGADGRAIHRDEPELVAFVCGSGRQHCRRTSSFLLGRCKRRAHPFRGSASSGSHNGTTISVARCHQIGHVARFVELFLLLLDGVAQIGELAIELLVVQPE